MINDLYGTRPTYSNESFSDLTKREYIAAMALQGLCSNPLFAEGKPSTLSATALNVADALITALNENK